MSSLFFESIVQKAGRLMSSEAQNLSSLQELDVRVCEEIHEIDLHQVQHRVFRLREESPQALQPIFIFSSPRTDKVTFKALRGFGVTLFVSEWAFSPQRQDLVNLGIQRKCNSHSRGVKSPLIPYT